MELLQNKPLLKNIA